LQIYAFNSAGLDELWQWRRKIFCANPERLTDEISEEASGIIIYYAALSVDI
jgi:hypothetical protein